MRTFMLAAVVVLSSLPPAVAVAADEVPIPKEGSSVSTSAGSGASKALALGKERVQIAWEYLGGQTNADPKSLTYNASFRCIGSLRALNGEYESYTNACVFTRPDGDQLYWVETGTGRLGGASKGTGTFVGGTGKLAGITGGGEWSRTSLRPAADGTFQTVSTAKVSYKLP